MVLSNDRFIIIFSLRDCWIWPVWWSLQQPCWALCCGDARARVPDDRQMDRATSQCSSAGFHRLRKPHLTLFFFFLAHSTRLQRFTVMFVSRMWCSFLSRRCKCRNNSTTWEDKNQNACRFITGLMFGNALSCTFSCYAKTKKPCLPWSAFKNFIIFSVSQHTQNIFLNIYRFLLFGY